MLKHRFLLPVTAAALAVTLVACLDDSTAPDERSTPSPVFAKSGGSDVAAALGAMMDDVNAALAEQGADYRVAMAEYVTGEGDEAGATVISKDVGNKQLGADFVPFDPRRQPWSGSPLGPDDDITYAVDQTGDAVPPIGGLSGAQTTAAIDRAMVTWDGVNCSTLPVTKNPDFGLDLGPTAFWFGLGGSPWIVADVMHAGWRDINFLGGILGATFTWIWVSGGVPTDIDNNGKLDVAFRDIYYDPSFTWADDGLSNFDVETVALHEAGHGLSQAHFGNIFFKNKGGVKRAPAAVMNPFIFGVDRVLYGTDNGGHCSNWAEWPNN